MNKLLTLLFFVFLFFVVFSHGNTIRAASCSGAITCNATQLECVLWSGPICQQQAQTCNGTGAFWSCSQNVAPPNCSLAGNPVCGNCGVKSGSCGCVPTCNGCGGSNGCGGNCPACPTGVPVPTTTVAVGQPTSTPAPVPTQPQQPQGCNIGTCNAGTACPGTQSIVGSCSGGVCCQQGNQCNGTSNVSNITFTSLGMAPDGLHIQVQVSWVSDIDPHHFGITVLPITPLATPSTEHPYIPSTLRRDVFELLPGEYEFRVAGKDNCDLGISTNARYIVVVPASCAINFGPILPPTAIVRGAPPVSFNVQVYPTNAPVSNVRIDLTNAAGIVVSPVQNGPWATAPTTLTFNVSAPFNSSNGFTLQAVAEMRGAGNVLLAQCSTGSILTSATNPNTSFFLTGGGGDVVAAAANGNGGNLKSNLANPDATSLSGYYLAHNPKPVTPVNLGIPFAANFASPLTSNNVNSKGWMGQIGGTGWETMRDKRENTYDAMKERVFAKMTATPYSTNSMTEVLNQGNIACTTTGTNCVAGVHIIQYGGAFGPAPIDIGNRKVLLFSDNGGVTTIQGNITVGPNGFFGFFTRGGITVADLVGEPSSNTDITAAAYPAQLAGVYFADGDFNFGGGSGVSLCTAVPTPLPPAIFNPNGSVQCYRQIRIDGSVIAMKEIKFNRKHLGDRPAEYINFRPDFAYQLYLIGLRSRVYQELLAP